MHLSTLPNVQVLVLLILVVHVVVVIDFCGVLIHVLLDLKLVNFKLELFPFGTRRLNCA